MGWGVAVFFSLKSFVQTEVKWVKAMQSKWLVTPAGVVSSDGTVRIAGRFIERNPHDAIKGYEGDTDLMAAVHEFQAGAWKRRVDCAKPERNRGQLLHEMKEAEGAEASFAKRADWHPARVRPARWYPGGGDKRNQWSAC